LLFFDCFFFFFASPSSSGPIAEGGRSQFDRGRVRPNWMRVVEGDAIPFGIA